MKKIISVIMSIALIAALFSACSGSEKNKKLSIVTTIFPEYDWVVNILGDKKDSVNLTLLLDSGVDLHSYQPTADDIVTISGCDLFIYAGGESDEWVDDALKEASNKDMIVIDLLEILGENAKEEETVEGMESEEHEEHEGHEDEAELDEHVWLSVRNAEVFCGAIKDALKTLDSENADIYEKNAEAYIEKLTELDGKYSDIIKNGTKNTIMFGDRFPFRYLTDDYGLSYYAAFSGCSAESEASFETIKFLADKTDELKLGVILTIEGTNSKIAQTVVSTAKNKNITILSMDSMQSTTMEDIKNSTTYLSVMEKNLEVLKEALK